MPYKNPPKTNRFHIGKSGNPFGRMPEITNKDLYYNLRILRALIDITMRHGDSICQRHRWMKSPWRL